jgi:hypothetical protein
LVANPKAVVEKELGAKLPEDLEIKVLEETEDTIYMVLPCNPYEGISEDHLKTLVGMTYEDVAHWVLEQQRNAFLDEENSVKIIALAGKNQAFKQELLTNPILVLKRELADKTQEYWNGITIYVSAETTHTIFFVLPDKITSDSTLLDLQLESNFNMPMVVGTCPGGYCTPGSTCG